MRMLRHGVLKLLAVLLLALGGTGCSKAVSWLDRADRGLPLMQSAANKLAEGDVDGAAELYTRSLEEKPGAARAHLDLALLLHDQKKDYIGAIYHYRRYLALRSDTEKEDMIEDRIRLARQALVGAVAGTAPESARELAELKKQNAALDVEVRRLTQQIEQLMGQLNDQATEVNRLRALDKARTARPHAAERQPETHAAVTPGPAAVPRTYKVMPGDSLISIAKDVYGNSRDWEKIYAANREKLGNSSRLKVGQLLVIP